MGYIKLINLQKKYNIDLPSEVHALRGINLEIEKGEMIAIMGISGSGKSTLLHILGCLDVYTSGDYYLENEKIDSKNSSQLALIRNKRIGFVLQEYGLLLNRTVYENISVPLLLGKTNYTKINQLCRNVAGELGIENLLMRKVDQLSGGQKQRVAIARAIINEPELILADEPTGALDTKTASEIMQILLNLNKLGKTIVIVTHDKHIASLCTKQIFIKDGLIYEQE